MDKSLIIIAHDVRSAHNVGALMRTCEGAGVDRLYLTGYTPYPKNTGDERLPYIADKVHARIQKTALGAEKLMKWAYIKNWQDVVSVIKSENYTLACLEQTAKSIPLQQYQVPAKLALIVGNEVEGVSDSIISSADLSLQIPMRGKKESFNVTEAASMAIYHCVYSGK